MKHLAHFHRKSNNREKILEDRNQTHTRTQWNWFALIVAIDLVSRIYFYRTVDCHALIKMKINKSIEWNSFNAAA